METKHTPTPWRVAQPADPKTKHGTDWRYIVTDSLEFKPSYVGEALSADADFVVDACNSIDDARRILADTVAEVGRLTMQRDELAAALDAASVVLDGLAWDIAIAAGEGDPLVRSLIERCKAAARAALAKLDKKEEGQRNDN
jgi:hypothetical protein